MIAPRPVAALVAACSLSACRSPAPPRPTAPVAAVVGPASLALRVEALVTPYLQGRWIHGVAIALVTPAGVWFGGYGHARGDGAAPDADTLFEVGSVSKIFTSLLLADEVERGGLTLDQPVQSLLPAGAAVPSRDGAVITLGELSSHVSGLPRMPPGFAPADPRDPYADFRAAQLLASLGAVTLTHRPGASYEYSNLGAGLLGFALAAHADASYEQLLRARVTGPLGLRDTTVTLSDAQRARFADGHDGDDEPAPHWNFGALVGAGGIRSTPRDLAVFVRANADTSAGALGAAMRRMQERRADADHGMAVGLAWHLDPAARVWWHNGETAGFHSLLAFDPARHLGVVVLANSAAGRVDGLGFALLRMLRGEAPALPALPVTVQPEGAALDRCVGEYALAPGAALQVTREGDHLRAQLTGQPALRVWASSSTEFYYRAVAARLSFTPGAGPHAGAVTLHQNGHEITAPRVTPGRPLP